MDKIAPGVTVSVCLIVVLLVSGVSSVSTSAEQPRVDTDCGAYVGVRRHVQVPGDDATHDVDAFLGIPYAAPPTGSRRWKYAQALLSEQCNSSATWTANALGDFCVQLVDDDAVGGSEDCLFLNVWRPAGLQEQRVPVLVYIHGGDLTSGSGGEAYNVPDKLTAAWAAAGRQVVVVTLNYRLSAFGFMALDVLTRFSDTNASGNWGITDQVQALRWVQQHIAAFGGDASRVTIMGQSSGGTSVLALLAVPEARGLFHGAVMMSSSYVFRRDLAGASKDNEVFVRRSPCADLADRALYDCLMALSAEDVMHAVPWYVYPWWGQDTGDLPTKGVLDGSIVIVDGHVIPQHPLEALGSGAGNDVPLVVGTGAQETDLWVSELVGNLTRKEFEALIWNSSLASFGHNVSDNALGVYMDDDTACPGNTSPPLAKHNRNQIVYDCMGTDMGTTCGSTFAARQAAESFSSPVYRYVFTAAPATPICYSDEYCTQFAFHTWDLMALFDTFEADGYSPAAQDLAFGAQLRDWLGQFVQAGRMQDKWGDVERGVAVLSSERLDFEERGYNEKQCRFWFESGLFEYGWTN